MAEISESMKMQRKWRKKCVAMKIMLKAIIKPESVMAENQTMSVKAWLERSNIKRNQLA